MDLVERQVSADEWVGGVVELGVELGVESPVEQGSQPAVDLALS
jgi:hypothetical protein